jgi:hypothetical protein
MINFPFYNPAKNSLHEYIKHSNNNSLNKLKEKYDKSIVVKEPLKLDYKIDFCDLSDFSTSDYHDDDDDDDKNVISKNNKYMRFFILSCIGTGSIISLYFVFYKIYIYYR